LAAEIDSGSVYVAEGDRGIRKGGAQMTRDPAVTAWKVQEVLDSLTARSHQGSEHVVQSVLADAEIVRLLPGGEHLIIERDR